MNFPNLAGQWKRAAILPHALGMDDRVFDKLREEYAGKPLSEESASSCPFEQFERWLEAAIEAGVRLANGMALATVGPDGQPSTRIVLLKHYDERGFVFFTNYGSRKGQELRGNPRASVLFWWSPLERQIRIQGRVERVSAADSDAYFATRPRASNLSAMASPQSEVVSNRDWLQERVVELESQWRDQELRRPESWGGYRLVPERFEMWQGRLDRLHDRLCYQRTGTDMWSLSRLAP